MFSIFTIKRLVCKWSGFWMVFLLVRYYCFWGLKWCISVIQSTKYTRLRDYKPVPTHLCTPLSIVYIYGCHSHLLSAANHAYICCISFLCQFTLWFNINTSNIDRPISMACQHKWDLKYESLAIRNPDKWLLFWQKTFEIWVNMSRILKGQVVKWLGP